MEKDYWGSKFYGSKLNTVLLLVLIVLMVFALRIMLKDKEKYLPTLGLEVTNNISGDILVDIANESFSNWANVNGAAEIKISQLI